MLTDYHARKSALKVNESFIVQAPAGSGKTGLLTQRFLALLATVNEPEECLAITFTRKAQAEMQGRIIAELQAAKDSLPVKDEYQQIARDLALKALAQSTVRGWELLDNHKRLKIKTIDSLCVGITSRMPVTSRFGGQVDVATDAQACFELAVDRVLCDANITEPYRQALHIVLSHLDNNRQKVKDLFLTMLPMREQWLPYLLHAKATDARNFFTAGLEQLGQEVLEGLVAAIPEELKDLPNIAQSAGAYLCTATSPATTSPIFILAEYATWPNTDLADIDAWLGWAELLLTKDDQWRQRLTVAQGFPAATEFKTKLEKEFYKAHKQSMMLNLKILQQTHPNFRDSLILLKQLPQLTYTDQQWQLVQALTVILPYLVAQLIVVFKETGQTDFSEINIAASSALGLLDEPSELALIMDYKLKHILVDEFQDTSIAQFKLLEQLTQGWYPDDGRTLFLVGDPMQSIYRFRQAEVSLFLQAELHGVGNVHLNSLKLTTNFRSDSALVAWHNQIFKQIFPAADNPAFGAVCYTPADPFIMRGDGGAEFYVLAKDNVQPIIELISNLRCKFPTDSIAVLVRAKRHLQHLVIELKRANIPFQGVEVENLMANSMIKDLLALTSALLHLGDRIAWLSILRAPWCGLSLADLHELFAAEHTGCVWQILQQQTNLSFDGKHRLQHFIPVLRQALAEKHSKPLSVLVKDTWRRLINPQEADQADAAKFFAMLQQYEDTREIYQIGFLQQKLQELFVSPNSAEQNAVQLMTMHKAKGLEFDHVILPGLGKISAKQDEKLLYWEQRLSTEHNPYLLLAPIKAVGQAIDLNYNFLKFMDRKKNSHELTRLFYVAATRAKKKLYGFGHIVGNKPAAGSFLGLLWDKVATIAVHADQMPDNKIDTIADQQHKLARLTHAAIAAKIQQNTDHLANAINPTNNTNHINGPELLRQTGILVHQVLAQIATAGLTAWQVISIEQRHLAWQKFLVAAGITGVELTAGLNTVTQAVANIINDPVGLWLLNHQHRESKVEWELMTNFKAGLKKFIIDRSFIDQDGTRWIVDYKTCHQHEIDEISPAHIAQLRNYKRIVAALKPKQTINLGIYFPLQAHWHILAETQLA